MDKNNSCYQFEVICQDFQNRGAKYYKLNVKGQLATRRVIQEALV